MEKYNICVEAHFSAAHFLKDSQTKECQQLHGHNWKVEVTFGSKTLNKSSMVLDFSIAKSILAEIVEEFDHALLIPHECGTIVNFSSLNEQYAAANVRGNGFSMQINTRHQKVVFVIENPTAETLSELIYEKVMRKIASLSNSSVSVRCVSVSETDNNKCTYYAQERKGNE